MDLHGRIEYANKQFLQDVGHTAPQVRGKTPVDLGILGDEEFARLKNEIVPRLTTEQPLANVEILVHRQGSGPFRVLLSFGLLHSATGDLQEYHERMQDAGRLASLGMLSVTLAHELTQPLSVIQLANQTALAELRRLGCPEAIKQDLQASITACAAIAALIGRFRDYARQSTRVQETEVDIRTVAEWTIRLLEHSAQQAKVALQTENLDALPAIRMRENELEQLFLTLAENAVQAADGMEDHYFLIAGALRDDEIELRFEDDCGGIQPAHLPKIFEPSSTTKPPGKGTGLGLCIARRIVRERGGRISIQNRYGEGATFIVTLPRY